MNNLKRVFIVGFLLGVTFYDMVNCHLWRITPLIHWIDFICLCLLPVLVYHVYRLIIGGSNG